MLIFDHFVNIFYAEPELAIFLVVALSIIVTASVTYFLMKKGFYVKTNLLTNSFELEKQYLIKDKALSDDINVSLKTENEKYIKEINNLRENAARLETTNSLNNNKIVEINSRLEDEIAKKILIESQYLEAQRSLSSISSQNDTMQNNLKLMNESLLHQFKTIANDILTDQSAKFSENSREKIDGVLNPLNHKLQEFQKMIKEGFDIESKERFSLKNTISEVIQSNNQIKNEASKLTNALKSNNMVLGHWGEMILENVLISSGLRAEQDYKLQEKSHANASRPDAIIYLPNKKSIVIDAKTSYFDTESFNNLTDKDEKNRFMNEFVKRIRLQIDNLASKEYHNNADSNTLDLTLMFIPVESWYNSAIQHDSGLYEHGWKKNIVLVSSSTLFVILKTIAHIWKSENQEKNVVKIAETAGGLYDHFVEFVEILKDFGKSIGALNHNYEKAISKLSSGNGNLLRRVQQIKLLGAKHKKNLDAQSVIDVHDDIKNLIHQEQNTTHERKDERIDELVS